MEAGREFRERAPVVAGRRVTVDAIDFDAIEAAVTAGNDWYSTAVVRDDEHVAFVRNRWSDGWVLPGGGIEARETPAGAARREVREETGLAVEAIRPIGYVEQRFEPPTGDAVAVGHMAVFAAEAVTSSFGDDLGETADEIEDAAWFADVPDRLDGVSRDLLERLLVESERTSPEGGE